MLGGDPLFSVILATRNRAALFAVALQSVLKQVFSDVEIIVVNDGSTDKHAALCRELVEAAAPRARMLTLPSRDRGHGQSYALNHGAEHARGAYLCFLDDDDQWTDPEHLARAAAVVEAAQPDLILANQQAFRDGRAMPGVVWIEDLKYRLPQPTDPAGAYSVSPRELLACPAHCHLNTTIVSRALYLEIGGLDEGLRYECDRDFYLRAIDRARSIKHLPAVVSRHNIPDPAAQTSMSTGLSVLSKRLYQLRVFDKAVLFSARPEVRRYAMRQRAYILRHIASEAARDGRFDAAASYARQALLAKFTLGWLGVTALFPLRRYLFSGALSNRRKRSASSTAATHHDRASARAPRSLSQ